MESVKSKTEVILESEKLENERFESWSKVGMLKGISNNYDARQVAVLLDSQRLFNRTGNHDLKFKRCSIPVVRRVYPQLVTSRIACVQSIITSDGNIFFEDKYGNLQYMRLGVKGRKLKSKWMSPDETGNNYSNLDSEAASCAQLASDICCEIDREVFNDLGRVASLKLEYIWNNKENFSDWLRIAGTKVNQGANWLVTSPVLGAELEGLDDFILGNASENPIYKFGSLFGSWDVFIDREFPDYEVLFGYRGNRPYDAGYMYCPFIPFSLMEDNEIYTHYGKKLINGDYYGKIIVEGHSIEEKDKYE